MIRLNKYIVGKDLTLEGFFMSVGMDTDETIGKFDFSTALVTAVPNLSFKVEDLLTNDYVDRRTGKISFTKFKKMFEEINSPLFRRGQDEGATASHSSFQDILQKIVNAISLNTQNIQSVFEKYNSYNRYTVHI